MTQCYLFALLQTLLHNIDKLKQWRFDTNEGETMEEIVYKRHQKLSKRLDNLESLGWDKSNKNSSEYQQYSDALSLWCELCRIIRQYENLKQN